MTCPAQPIPLTVLRLAMDRWLEIAARRIAARVPGTLPGPVLHVGDGGTYTVAITVPDGPPEHFRVG